MFSSIRIDHSGGFIEYRTENHTGFRTRICPERLKRGIGFSMVPDYSSEGCPFCPDLINTVTPVFSDGSRIYSGESVTFPN
ncbi:MAG: galactose-1-phosphate uridylyltransferase, partial [Methanobacteriota archaeon]